MSAHRIRLIIAFAAIYIIWGSTYLAIRFAIETLPPFLMAGTRFLIAGSALMMWMRWRGEAWPTLDQWRVALVVGAFLLLGGNGAVVWAEQRVPSGLAALLIATEPAWVVVVDWVRPGGTRPGGGVLAGIVTGFLGVAWLLSPAELVGGEFNVDLVGAAVLLFAALSWAIGSVYSRYAERHDSAFMTTAMKMVTGGGCLLLAGTISGEWSGLDLTLVTSKSILAFLYLIVAGSLIGFTAYIWLLENTSLAKASTYAYVNPLVAVLLGGWLASEPMTLRIFGATAVIVMGVIVISQSQHSLPSLPPPNVDAGATAGHVNQPVDRVI